MIFFLGIINVKNIKICQGIDSFYPIFDGPVQIVSNYAKELNLISECKVTAPSSGIKGFVDTQPYTVFRCRSIPAPLGYRFALPCLDGNFKKFLKTEKFDIFHLHSPFSISKSIIKFARRHKIPVVITLHTKFDQDVMRVTNAGLLKKIFMHSVMKSFNKADFVWTLNQSMVEVLRGYGFKGAIEVVKNATDFNYSERSAALKKERIIQKHNLTGELVLAFIGRIVMYKNLALICDSLKLAKQRGLRFKVLIVGGGTDEAEFKAKVAECGLSGEFIFVGRVSDREELSAYYLAADLLFFPSTFDASPLVVIEAAAHKLPTLLTKGATAAEGKTDDVDAFLSEENPESYAERIIAIATDRAHLRQVGENAYKSIYCSWTTTVKTVYAKYLDLIEQYNAIHNVTPVATTKVRRGASHNISTKALHKK
jgi:glycosyltransferase involved in cell wall biosynthesis